MQILLTGSHGFVGTHFKNKYPREVIPWDLKINKDICKITPEDLAGIDVIVHLAAKVSVEQSWANPFDYYHNNTYGTLKLMDAANKAGVKRIVYASSSSVYGNPLSPYGASKLNGEHIIMTYSNWITPVILRFYNIYGKGQNPAYAGVITKFMQCIKEEQPLPIYGDGEQTRDFTYVEDVADVLIQACTTADKRVLGTAIDVGCGRPTSVNKLADLMLAYAGKTLPINHLPARVEIRHSKCPSPAPGKWLLQRPYTYLEDGIMKVFL